MLSKSFVKAALLLSPPAAAAHPIPPSYVCHPLSSWSRSACVWVVMAVPLLCCVGRCWSKTHYGTCLHGQWATPAAPHGWLLSVPCCNKVHGTACCCPSLPYSSMSGGEATARGFPGRASRHRWKIYRQPKITVNAGYQKGQLDHH